MVFITSKTLGVWSSNARLLTVVFFPLVSIGDALDRLRFVSRKKGEIIAFWRVPGKGLQTPGFSQL